MAHVLKWCLFSISLTCKSLLPLEWIIITSLSPDELTTRTNNNESSSSFFFLIKSHPDLLMVCLSPFLLMLCEYNPVDYWCQKYNSKKTRGRKQSFQLKSRGGKIALINTYATHKSQNRYGARLLPFYNTSIDITNKFQL